jgi:hypothetical protein
MPSFQLMHESFSFFSELAKLHGIDPLISLLADSVPMATANGAVVLTNMATDEALRSQIQASGVVTALIEPLSSESVSCNSKCMYKGSPNFLPSNRNTIVQSKCSLAIAAFLGDCEARANVS